MDVMLQRHCARYIYVVPDGLRELMSDISREVLRSQPEDIYTFVADYLDALLITRENARISAKFVQTMTDAAETIVELLERSGMTRSAADHAAEVIQEAFRTWSSRRGILKEDEDAMINRIIEDAGITELQAQEAAVCIQHAFQAFKIRQQREQELLGDTVDWRVAARSAIRLYRKTGVSPEEAKKAANTIKAAYKGYYTRRALQKLNEVNATVSGEEEEYEEYENMSVSSALSGDKKKGVRLDYATILPHVDFGGEEMIEKDIDVIAEDEHFPVETLVDETEEDDVMKKIFGGTRKAGEPSSESFIKGILDECFKSAVIKKYQGKKDSNVVMRAEPIKEEEPLDTITKEEEEFQQGAMVAKEIIEKLQEKRESQQVSQTTEKETVEEITTTTEKEDFPTEPVESEPPAEQPAESPETPAEEPEQPLEEETNPPAEQSAEEPEQLPTVEETKPSDEQPAEEEESKPPEEPLVEETVPEAEQPAEEPEQPPVEDEQTEPPADEQVPLGDEQMVLPGDGQTDVPPAEEPPTEKPIEITPPEAPPQHPEGPDQLETASVQPDSKSIVTESSVLI